MTATGIIYLEPNGLKVYARGLAGIAGCAFPKEAAHDMEIIDRKAFETALGTFLTEAKLPPTAFILLLSPEICFDHPVEATGGTKHYEEIKQFTDVVPFEAIKSTEIKTKDGLTYIAVNEDYYEGVKSALSHLGHTVYETIPYFLPGSDGYAQFDEATAKYVLKKADAYRKQAFDAETPEEKEVSQEEFADAAPARQPKSQLPLLLGVFAVLIVVLVIMVLAQKGAF